MQECRMQNCRCGGDVGAAFGRPRADGDIGPCAGLAVMCVEAAVPSRPPTEGGRNMVQLETSRLILRPFTEEDAADLYEYAKDPRVGPIAGWPAHKSVEESREIIRTVFSAPNVFAVVDKQFDRAIGSAGFVGGHWEGVPKPDDEIGYALNPDFWGRGLIPEAVTELLRYGFEELGLAAIWCAHYEGNDKSRRVIEKCGFRFRYSRETDVSLLNERRMTHFYALTKEEWQSAR